MPLPETFTNATPARDVHAAAHNETNLTVNDLLERLPVGTGSPEGVVTAPVGSVYQRIDGGTNTSVYRKESGGAGNTGWVAVANGGVGGDATTLAGTTPAQLRDRATHTGTQSADSVTDGTTNHVFTVADDTKLAGIATAATANSSDATLLGRANHTGTQSADTLTDGTTNKAFLATERTKLSGVATAATANDTDANLKARANHTGTQLAATISDFTAAVGLAIPVAPSTEVAYAQITADQAFTVDNLNIDLVSGLAVTIPNIAVPVYVYALIGGKHSATSAVINANLCKTSPTPATILDALAMGFACCTVIGNQANCAVVARIPPSTPCTVQLYVSGNSGTMTVLAQTYAPSKIWAMTA